MYFENELQLLLERSKQRKSNVLPVGRLRRRALHPHGPDEAGDCDEERENINLINETEKEELLAEAKLDSSCLSYVVVACILATCFGIAYFQKNAHYEHIKSNVVDPELLTQYREAITPYTKQFPSQSSKLWIELFASITLTSKSNRLSVFLILHDDKTNTSCLAQALGRVSAMLLVNSTQPLIVSASNLQESATFRRDLVDRRVVVVEELQEMPVGENQTLLLHSLADAENPIAPGIAVVFTLRLQKNYANNALKAAELELARAWERIDSESRQRLIMRVTGGFVYKMTNEFKGSSC